MHVHVWVKDFDSITMFQDLTGIEDIERCRETLERHNWDIEVRFLYSI